MKCPITGADCLSCEDGGKCRLGDRVFVHMKRDPRVCIEGHEHEFEGWREFDDGNGGETICKHCGTGAMEYTMACDPF